MQQDVIYDGQFCGKALIAGKTGCRKTYFVQKLAVSNFKRKDCKDRMGIIYSVR